MTHVLVTGGNGFIGRSLIRVLADNHYSVHATYHGAMPEPQGKNDPVLSWRKYDLASEANNYSEILDGIDVIVHLAGMAHMPVRNQQSVALIRKTNIDGTRKLVTEAVNKGVGKIVFVSTIKVHGERAESCHDGVGKPFTEKDTPAPLDPYAVSKLEAEQVIKEACSDNRMQYVILRPPLVYGPFVKANFLKLLDMIASGLPLPFGSIKNLRSLVYVGNLCDAISTVIERKEAANNTYLVSDVNISLPQLIREIAKHQGKTARLFPFPVSLLRLAGVLTGRKSMVERLTESLQADSSKIRNDLQWKPRVTFEEGIKATVEWYKRR
jgi:nucleoside-diphosphate-sugar epimerase